MRVPFTIAWALLLAGFACLGQASAYWQSRDSNYNNISAAAPVTFAIAYENNSGANTSACTSCTITGMAFGSPGANDMEVALFCSRSGGTPSSPVIGGVNATLLALATQTGNGSASWIAYLPGGSNPTGSTISFTLSTAPVRFVLTTYKVTTSTPAQTPTANSNSNASASTITAALTIPSGGGAVSCAEGQSPTTFAYSSGVTTTDENIVSTNAFLAGRSAAGDGSSVNFTAGGNSNSIVVAAAAFTP